jgi:AcrR family transcriptional regulator
MEEIAVSCGVTAPIVYRHFASKEELYRAVLESIGESLRDSLPNPAAPFGIDLEAFLSAARGDPDGFHLFWVHAAREPQFSAYSDELRERAVAAVGKALKDRVPRSMREWTAHAIVGFAVEGLLNWLRYGDPREDARILAATEGALRAGVRAWAAKSPRKRRSS